MGIGVSDVDDDGAPDVITVGRHDGVLLQFPGDGTGDFGKPRTVDVEGLSLTRRLTVADVDGDGVDDVLVPDEASASVVVLIGGGDGTFQVSASFDTGGVEPVAIAVADVDHDGSADLITANGYPAHDLSVLLGDGKGSFGEPATFATGFAPHSVVATDLNGDGVVDLATGDVGDSTVSILLGVGDGTFADPVAVSTGSTASNNTIAVADLNGDGAPDLVTANYKPASDVTVLVQKPA
jgi:hypothetical protein